MKTLVAKVAFLAVAIGLFGYGLPFFTDHRTIVTSDEIVIGRTGFLTVTTYAIDRRTGDERLVFSRHLPFVGYYSAISFSGSCKCVTRVYRSDAGGKYSIYRYDDGTVHRVTGLEIDHVEIVPFEQAQNEFNDAQSTIDGMRKRYASVMSQR